MESPRLSDPAVDDASPASPRNRLMVVAILCAPLLVGGLLLFGTRESPPPSSPIRMGGMRPVLSPSDSMDELPRVPDFPDSGPSPAGDVSLQNVRFAPTTVPAFMGPFQRLSIRYIGNGGVKLTEEETNTEEETSQERWRGPIQDAVFIEEVAAGVHTIKVKPPSGDAQPIWTNAAEVVPNLQLQRDRDGRSRLLDRSGTILWSGLLNVPPGGASGNSSGNTHHIEAGGVQIDGEDGTYTVKNAESGSVLWSGHLPTDPVLLVRDGHNFLVVSPNRAEGAQDNISRVRFEEEAGTVTVSDRKKKTIGTRSVTILKTYQERETVGVSRPHQAQVIYTTPDATLTANGTIFLSYADSHGQIIRRSKVFKHAHGSGRFN